MKDESSLAKCGMNEIKTMNATLDTVKVKQRCKIIEVLGCGKAFKRLSELGINKNAQLVVVKNDIGPVIVQLAGYKIALGRCLANKVIVEVIK